MTYFVYMGMSNPYKIKWIKKGKRWFPKRMRQEPYVTFKIVHEKNEYTATFRARYRDPRENNDKKEDK